MNKWLILFATVLFTFAFAYTIQTTLRNPSWSNIGISFILLFLMFIGLRNFWRAGKPKKQIINNQEMIPKD